MCTYMCTCNVHMYVHMYVHVHVHVHVHVTCHVTRACECPCARAAGCRLAVEHRPRPEHSRSREIGQAGLSHSAPPQPASHWHTPASRSQLPWPEQPSRHGSCEQSSSCH